MTLLLDILSWIFLMTGSFLCITGGLGVIRFPDFYTRMHAAGITDTMGAAMIIIGLMFEVPDIVVLSKLVLILAFLFFTSPTASHALAKAALHSGLPPLLDIENKDRKAGVQEFSDGR